MKTGKQLHIKWILWGIFIALNIIPFFYPNESTMWTLRALGYQIEGLNLKSLTEIKVAHFVDDSKDRHLELKDLTLNFSKDPTGFAVALALDSLSYKDRHLPNYKLKDLLKGMMVLNAVSMGPGLTILGVNIEHLDVEFSESSAPFKIDSLKVANVNADDNGLHIGALQMSGPNLRYQGNKLEMSVSPEQFSDIEKPQEFQFAFSLNPLSIDGPAVAKAIQEL